MIAFILFSFIASIAPLCSCHAGDRAGNGGDTTFINPISYLILDGKLDHVAGHTVCYGQEYANDRHTLCEIFSNPDARLNSRQRDFSRHCCKPGFDLKIVP